MKLITKYAIVMGSITAAFTNFIACGAQKYKASLTEDHVVTNEDQQANSTDPNSPDFGLHAPQGWDSLPIRYKSDPTMTSIQLAALQAAMTTWELATGKILFKYEGPHSQTTGDSFPDLFSSLRDSVNGEYLDKNWKKTGKGNDVLATTVWSNSGAGYSVINASDIHYNHDLYYISDALKETPVDNREIVDMQSLATHELGHLLGLAHIEEDYDSSSIMNPSLIIGEGLATRGLSVGDIKRIQKIYGCSGNACDAEKTARLILQTAMKSESTASKVSH